MSQVLNGFLSYIYQQKNQNNKIHQPQPPKLSQSVFNGCVKSAKNYGFIADNTDPMQWLPNKPSIMHNDILKSYSKIKPRWVVNSTQSLLKRCKNIHNILVVAEYQTQGIGRRGNSWTSTAGSNLCMSFGYVAPKNKHILQNIIPTLSIAVGIIITKMLLKNGFTGLSIKWPNDIMLNGKKLAGIIVDNSIQSQCNLVIGFGINCYETDNKNSISQSWSCLAGQNNNMDRGALVKNIYESLVAELPFFCATGLQPYMQFWQDFDYLKDQQIEITNDQGVIRGRYLGIKSSGLLIIKQENGIITTINSRSRCRLI